MRLLLSLVILNFSVLCNGAMDYCNLRSQAGCRDSKEHVYCMFPDETPKCDEMEVTTTDEFRKIILNMHNDFRNKWAAGEWPKQKERGFKPAANMKLLSWDEELETLARRHLVGCLENHESCMLVERFFYGQNFGLDFTKRKVSEPESIFYPWVNEFKDFRPEDVYPVTQEALAKAGHFTALAWANTSLVGCVEGRYKSAPNGPWKGEHIRKLVCDYAPKGNRVNTNDSVYEVGPPCSKCPEGFPCSTGEYKNLCASGTINIPNILNFFILLYFTMTH